MSEVLTTAQEAMQEQVIIPLNTFDNDSWSEKPLDVVETVAVQTPASNVATPPVVETPVVSAAQDVVIDETDWLKEFGWEDKDKAKTELAELRLLRETATTKEEIKFANEQSQRLYESLLEGKEDVAYEILEKKRTLARVPDMNAIDALKLKIKLDNPLYKETDINDIIEDQYTMPEKPIKGDLDDDDEHEAKVSRWQTSVDKITRRIERDALAAKADLAKLQTELVLPDIQKKETPRSAEDEQKELALIQQRRDVFLSKVESDFKNFNGYEAKYKDEEVEIPVSFGMSEDDKITLKEELKDFNVDDFILSRWFSKEGQPNVVQMMEDVTLLRKKEDIMQKMVNEIGSKMREHYIKKASNITVTGSQNSNLPVNTPQSDLDKQIAYIWANS